MAPLRIWLWLGIWALAWLPLEAAAATFCGVGATPRPSEPSEHVRLVDEDVRFVRVDPEPSGGEGGGVADAGTRDETSDAGVDADTADAGVPDLSDAYWRVETSYALKNTSDERLEQVVEFHDKPVESDCPNCECVPAPTQVEVDGKPAEPTGAGPYRLGLVIPPGESRTITRTYIHAEPANSSPVGAESITYDTKPGSRWKGSIGRTRIVYEFLRRPWTIRYPAPRGGSGRADDGEFPEGVLEYVRQVEKLVDGESTIRAVFGARDWEPDRDVAVYVVSPDPYMLTGSDRSWVGVIHKCPYYGGAKAYREARDAGNAAEAEDLIDHVANNYPAELLRKCRHVVDAHHGRDFEDDELDAFFYGSGQPSTNTFGLTKIGFQKNPAFEEGMLQEWERSYRTFVEDAAAYQRKHDIEVAVANPDAGAEESDETPAEDPDGREAGSQEESSTGLLDLLALLGNGLLSMWPLLIPIGVIGVPILLFFVVRNWLGAREMDRAEEAACLMCDSKNLDKRSEDEFECRDCGFDTSWSRRQGLQTLFQQLRELREAERSFQRAADEMKSAKRWALFDIFGGSGHGKHGAMNAATRAQVEGLTTLKDLADDYPELLDMHIAGENMDVSTFADIGMDSIGADIKAHRQITESMEQVEAFLEPVASARESLVAKIRDRADNEGYDVAW